MTPRHSQRSPAKHSLLTHWTYQPYPKILAFRRQAYNRENQLIYASRALVLTNDCDTRHNLNSPNIRRRSTKTTNLHCREIGTANAADLARPKTRLATRLGGTYHIRDRAKRIVQALTPTTRRTPSLSPANPTIMSGEGPESVPTSADPRSKRAVKKRALTPVSAQASSVDALFARPDQDIRIPDPSSALSRSRVAPPPEIVTNVQGSSAGAGSGEFHVYKASRRREYERLRQMDEEVKQEQETEEFERKREELARKDDEKTRRNREKREKMKARKAKAKAGGGAAAKVPINGTKGPRIAVTRAEEDTEIKDAPAAAEEPQGLIIEDD